MTKPGEHIKRPMNAYMVWSRKERRRIAEECPRMLNSEISKRLGMEWNSLTPDQKDPYVEEAKKLREKHKKDHPEYKYQPKRKPKALPKLKTPGLGPYGYPDMALGVPPPNSICAPLPGQVLPPPSVYTSSCTGNCGMVEPPPPYHFQPHYQVLPSPPEIKASCPSFVRDLPYPPTPVAYATHLPTRSHFSQLGHFVHHRGLMTDSGPTVIHAPTPIDSRSGLPRLPVDRVAMRPDMGY